MTTQMPELKPCPFCGSSNVANISGNYAGPTNVWHAGDEIFAVNCKGCGASVPNRYANDLVVAAWNTRAAIEASQLSDKICDLTNRLHDANQSIANLEANLRAAIEASQKGAV